MGSQCCSNHNQPLRMDADVIIERRDRDLHQQHRNDKERENERAMESSESKQLKYTENILLDRTATQLSSTNRTPEADLSREESNINARSQLINTLQMLPNL